LFFVILYLRRTVHPAHRPRPVRAARAAQSRHHHRGRLVPDHLYRQPVSAGLVGSLWSRFGHGTFFTLLALLAALGAIMLWLLNPAIEKINKSKTQHIQPGEAYVEVIK
jgi:hypothetical protein